MPRKERAKQFAPFDALKGLQNALRLKEYEHDQIIKGELSEDQIEEISRVILELNNGDVVEVKYFFDGYFKNINGQVQLDIQNKNIIVENTTISFDSIVEITKTTS